ncbi:hypothetical protein KR222_006252, partial [Zaprionus bogoriensis]
NFSFSVFVKGFLAIIDVDITTELNCYKVKNANCPNDNVTIWLYNSDHPNGILLKEPLSEYFDSNSQKPLKILFHDFDGNRITPPNSDVRPMLLNIPDLNVITVDYSKLAVSPCYTEAVHNAPYVGNCLGTFIANLVGKHYVHESNLHFIGLGVGAHVAAFTSNFLSDNYNIHVQRISGLDPAKLFFLTRNLTARLDRSDAVFVDVIHTDILLTGFLQPIGHVDFYPNLGLVQPNCGEATSLTYNLCNHKRSSEYYAESVNPNSLFWALHCSDLYTFYVKKCPANSDMEKLGYYTRQSTRGAFFLGTNDNPPYAKGMQFEDLNYNLTGKTFLGDGFLAKLAEL